MGNTLIRVRNTVLHILLLAALFVGALAFFEYQINQSVPDSASSMSESTFPLVYMRRGDVSFNCLSGYAQEMDVSCMRDCITPLSSDRRIGIRIQTFAAAVDSISYQVISRDGSETLENTQVIKMDRNEDTIDATLTLQGKMLMNEEYVLVICLNCGGRVIRYYTDVLLADGLHTDDYLNYVSGFYDKTVNRTDLGSVGAAVEPDDTTDIDATLAYMDIHDSVDQLTWSALKPQIYYKPTPRIREINTQTASLTLEYRIAAAGENGSAEVYNVNEFYRVRYTDSRVFLLNFERTTDEVFDPENGVLTDKGIRLGITGKDVQYSSDEKGRIIAFVQENELWTFERSTSKLTQVFSFPQKENMDYRDFKDASSIRILRVSTSGDVWFTVSGYMNRGPHEGQNGVVLYYYDTASDLLEEQVFLVSSENPDLVQRDVETLAYVTEDTSLFYVYLEEQLWKVRIVDRTFEIAAENVREKCCAGSAKGRYFAWLEEGDPFESTVLCWTDLEDGVAQKVSCAAGEKIRPLAYMGEDLVYGLARDEDIAAGTLDTGLFPMYSLQIMNGEGTIVKNYEPAGYLVTDVTQSDHMLTLERVSRSAGAGGLAPAQGDEIVNTDTSADVAIGIATAESARKQNQIYLRVGGSISSDTPNIVMSKLVNHSGSREITIPRSTSFEGLYFVYAGGRLREMFTRANEAVALADTLTGVAVDNLRSYIWVRGDKGTRADVSLEEVPEEMKAGVRSADELPKRDGMHVLDLSGCTLDEVLYYVSHGYPVAAVTKDGPVTIVGYDEYNTHLLDPGDHEWHYYGINDSTELFEESGNLFFTYIQTYRSAF